MGNIFFTSDTHFGHANFVRGESRWSSGYRDFETTKEMDECILENINAVVKQRDTLFHLGDFCFGNAETWTKYRRQIACSNVILLWGNHDKRERFRGVAGLFKSTHDYKEIEIAGQDIILCHYPLSVWNKAHYDSWHLYGHVHGRPVMSSYQKLLDVSVDNHDFKPVSFEDVRLFMNTKPKAGFV